ncbi:MAG TPA: hypothetical protein VHT91_39500 [Kofleriaceae bacterium]|nr:hypothetical protein [Kofleriaceae bacterium]
MTVIPVCATRTSGRFPVTLTEPTAMVSPTMMHASGCDAVQLAGNVPRHNWLAWVSSVAGICTWPLALASRQTCQPLGP